MRSLSTPSAIVVAGALIGAGIYLGLRARAPAEQVARPTSTAAAGSQPSPTDGTPAVQRDPRSVRRDGEAAAEGFRRRMLERCWAPAIAARPQPATSKYVIDFLYAPDGLEISRGISEARGTASRPDVAQCLRREPIGLRIPPPGGPVRLQLDVVFP